MEEHVKITVGADITRYQQGLKQVVTDAKASSQQLSGSFDSANRGAAGFFQKTQQGFSRNIALIKQHRLAILGTVTAAVGAGAAIIGLVKHATAYADEMGKASQITGVAVETLSGLRFAADLAGVSFAELTRAFSQSAKVALDAAHGNERYRAAFKALGIEVTDQNETLRANEQILLDIADRFQEMPDGIHKTAAAQRIFGESGARLIPLLNQGREGIAAYSEEARRLGLEVTPAMAKSAEEFNDNLQRLTKSLMGTKVVIGNLLIPTAMKLLDILGKLGGVRLEGAAARALEGPIELIDKQIASAEERLQRMGAHPLLESQRGVLDIQLQGMRRDRSDLENQLDRLRSGPSQARSPLAPSMIEDSSAKTAKAAIDSAKAATDSLIESLKKQHDALVLNVVELQEGSRAAQELKLQLDFADLTDKFKIPPQAREEIEKLMVKVLEFGDVADASKRRAEDLAKQFASIDQEQDAAIAGGKDLIAVLAEVHTLGLSPLEKEIEEINREFDAMKVKALEAAAATSQGVQSVLEGIEFHRRQRVLATATGETGADIMDRDFGDMLNAPRAAEEASKAGNIIEVIFRNTIERMQGNFSDLWYNVFSGGTDSAKDFFRQLAQTALRTISDIMGGLMTKGLSSLLIGGGGGGGGFGGIAGAIGSGIGSLFSGGGGIASSIFSGIGSLVGGLFGFHEGGLVPSFANAMPRHSPVVPRFSFATGGEVPILATPGEYVMRPAAVAKWGVSTFESMNRSTPDNKPSWAGGSPGMSAAQPASAQVQVLIKDVSILDPKKLGLQEREIISIFVNGMRHDTDIRSATRENIGR